MATDLLEPPATQGRLLDVRRRITVEEYHRLIDSGILGPDPRVELLEGVIVEKMTEKTAHVQGTDLLDDFLHRHLPGGCGYFASMGNPLTIEDRDGEPEPDGMVVRGEIRDFTNRRRTPADAALVAEISDTSYNYDRYDKWTTYAASRVPVYWIVDLNHRKLEIHTEPTGDAKTARYARSRIYGPDDEAALVLDGREIARFLVREILP